MRERKVLVLLSMLVSSVLAGCLLRPINERGTIYTPAPTRAVTAEPSEPPLEEWQGLFIPKQCVRGVPRGWAGNTLKAISSSGQWIAYVASLEINYHFSIYNLLTGEWRTPAAPFAFNAVKWGTDDRGLYHLSLYDHDKKPEERKLWWINLETMQAKEIRDCPHCVEFDVLETESILAATRGIKRGWLQIDMVGWTEPFTAAVTVDSVKRGGVGPISLSPHGKRLAYSAETKDKGIRQFPMRIQELGSGAIVTLTENSMPDAWLTDDVILDPDPEAMRVWRHNLVTGERVVFAEVDRDLSSVYAIGQGSPYTGIRGVAIARDTRFLLFEPLRETSIWTGTIFVADLRCSRRVSAEQR